MRKQREANQQTAQSRPAHACSLTTRAVSGTDHPTVACLYQQQTRKAVELHWQSCGPSERSDRGHGSMLLGGTMDYSFLWLTGCSEIILFHSCHSNHHSFGGPWNSKSLAEAAAANADSVGHVALLHVARIVPKWRCGHTHAVCVPST